MLIGKPQIASRPAVGWAIYLSPAFPNPLQLFGVNLCHFGLSGTREFFSAVLPGCSRLLPDFSRQRLGNSGNLRCC